ncbi:protein RER1 [Arapaima gigas]
MRRCRANSDVFTHSLTFGELLFENKPERVVTPRLHGARMSEGDSTGESIHGKPSVISRFFTGLGQIYQSWLDKSTPFSALRWGATLLLTAVYMIRVYFLQGWYIVTYALGIYHLNLFIAFLSPKVDPSLLEDSGKFKFNEGPELPTKQNEEFRPFIRRLPEFKFWHSATKGIIIAMICTFFDAFNVPVFWPILVMYFIMLFCITMKRQIKHMIKYRYIPFTHGKRTYRGKEDTGKTFAS